MSSSEKTTVEQINESGPYAVLGREFDFDKQKHVEIDVVISAIYESYGVSPAPSFFAAYPEAVAALLDEAQESSATDEFKDDALEDFTLHYSLNTPQLPSLIWLRSLSAAATESGVEAEVDIVREHLPTVLDPDISKRLARQGMRYLGSEAQDPNKALDAIAITATHLMLSGKNSFKTEIAQKASNIETVFKLNEPAVYAVVNDLHMHMTEDIKHLPTAVHSHMSKNLLRYEAAKRVLPVFSALRRLKALSERLDAPKARLASIQAVQYLLEEATINKFMRQPGVTDVFESVDILDSLKPMELDWSILPEGELEKSAREIVDSMQSAKPGKEIIIDLERLKSLEEIRSSWGADKSYYARGSLKNRKTIRKDGNECPDEYIVLVLQTIDENNNTEAEHAVAESPIVGPHAMYVYRQDAGEGFSWRDVMAMSKQDAKLFNARALKHNKNGPTVSEKAIHLLGASKEEFLRIRNYRIKGFTLPRGVVEIVES